MPQFHMTAMHIMTLIHIGWDPYAGGDAVGVPDRDGPTGQYNPLPYIPELREFGYIRLDTSRAKEGPARYMLTEKGQALYDGIRHLQVVQRWEVQYPIRKGGE